MVEVPNNSEEFRYEKKFFTSSEFLNDIYFFLKSSQIGFLEIFSIRKVNSLYLDNIGHDSYLDSISGISSRRKLRLRWYGYSNINFPTLEVKKKEGSVGLKHFYKVGKFDISKPLSRDYLKTTLKDKDFYLNHPEMQSYLMPKLYCSYIRRYFSSNKYKIRITVDHQISYSLPSIGKAIINNKFIFDPHTVLEVKYSSKIEISEIKELFNFPIYSTRFSKFTNGIDQLI